MTALGVSLVSCALVLVVAARGEASSEWEVIGELEGVGLFQILHCSYSSTTAIYMYIITEGNGTSDSINRSAY